MNKYSLRVSTAAASRCSNIFFIFKYNLLILKKRKIVRHNKPFKNIVLLSYAI